MNFLRGRDMKPYAKRGVGLEVAKGKGLCCNDASGRGISLHMPDVPIGINCASTLASS